LPLFEAAGWLIRAGSQFHWQNQDYAGFDDFLAVLASRKRKAIRKERAAAVEGLDHPPPHRRRDHRGHWDAFWNFYQDTGSAQMGPPLSDPRFFSLLGERMADKVLLILAERDGGRSPARST
jgi:predicted N-acyltransferase